MMLRATPTTSAPSAANLSLQLSILWWRLVIFATRAADRLMVRSLPILLPLRPFWWIPLGALVFGFSFGFGAMLLIL
jgi:hypothetical protein